MLRAEDFIYHLTVMPITRSSVIVYGVLIVCFSMLRRRLRTSKLRSPISLDWRGIQLNFRLTAGQTYKVSS